MASYASRLNQNTFPTRNKNLIRKAKVIHVADSRATETNSCFAIWCTPPVHFSRQLKVFQTERTFAVSTNLPDGQWGRVREQEISLNMECHRRGWRHTLLLMALVNNATLVSHFRGFVQVDIFRTVHIYI